MMKRVITAGLLGGIALVLWTFVVNGLTGFHSRMFMRTIPAERQVHELLKEHVVDPGRYVVNPELTSEQRFPGGEPVFTVSYSGMGHEAAGQFMLLGLVVFLVTPVIGAWLLSHASAQVLSSYPRKVLFFAGIGLLLGIFNGLTKWDIGGLPLSHALLLLVRDVVTWVIVGLVVAWRLRPKRQAAASG